MLVVESSGFTKRLPGLLDDEGYALLKAKLAVSPDAGQLMPGTGGLRRLRWRRPGTGKRGGLRVIYYWWSNRDRIHLLSIYAKSHKSDLTTEEKSLLRKELENLVHHDDER